MQNLYRHFGNQGELLYVGVSLNTLGRLAQHKCTAIWFKEIKKVEIEQFENREDALKAEQCAILKEHPIYNIRGVKRKGNLEKPAPYRKPSPYEVMDINKMGFFQQAYEVYGERVNGWLRDPCLFHLDELTCRLETRLGSCL